MATVFQPNASCVNAQRAELLRLRTKYLKNDRILGPAWSILIRLLSRDGDSASIEVCDLISIRCVPATTAQRCLEYLVAQGLVRLGDGPGKRFRSVLLAPRTALEIRSLFLVIDDLTENEREVLTELS